MSKLIKVAITADLPPGQAMAFEIEGERIAVFNVNGTYYAIDDVCTHAGASLSEGCVEGFVVRCPRHEAEFDLRNGETLSPPADLPVKTYPVTIEGDDIKVQI
jgi:3-phenylpropionate/trans-cinnamate dioxygenase ferredoxin subunit